MFSRRISCLVLVLVSIFLTKNCVSGGMTMQQMENAAAGLRKVCLPKTGADPAIVAAMQKGEFPEDEKFQCYLKCIMGLLKTIKNGKPAVDTIIKQITMMMPPELHERNINAAKTCSEQNFSDDVCVAAWQFIRCQYQTDPEVFFFP